MRQLLLNQRGLAVAAGVSAGLVFTAMLTLQIPTVSLSHFFYVPIALAALAAGPRVGALAGVAASGLSSLGILFNPTLAQIEPVPSLNMVERLLAYVLIGSLIGWSAQSNRRLLAHLRHYAERDHLTGLLNMRAFEGALTQRIAADRPFALLLGDVDRLKDVNDSLGHAEGNELLRRVAAALHEALPSEDETSRLGGDEFAAVSSLATREEAAAACRRLETIVGERAAAVTFGWAVYPADGDDALTLFHVADKRLYEGKLSGGDRPRTGLLHRVS